MSNKSRFERLELQMDCTAKGHKLSISDNGHLGVCFECIHCGVWYWRKKGQFTKKEQALLTAFDLKGD